MLKVLSYILCDLDPKVKVIGQKAGICDGVPSTSALVLFLQLSWWGGKRWLLWLVCLHVSRDCCVAPTRGAMGLSAACDRSISWSYSLTILIVRRSSLISHVTHIKHVLFQFVVYLYKDSSCLAYVFVCILEKMVQNLMKCRLVGHCIWSSFSSIISVKGFPVINGLNLGR